MQAIKNLLSMIKEALSILIDVLNHVWNALGDVIDILTSVFNAVYNMIDTLPTNLKAFATAVLFVTTLYMVLGRSGGKSSE